MSLELALEAVNRTLKPAAGVGLEVGVEVALLDGLWLALKGAEHAASRNVSRTSGNRLRAFRLGELYGTRKRVA